MKILVSDLPRSSWWGNGMPVYDNNWKMATGVTPNQHVVAKAHQAFMDTLPHFADVITIPFPAVLDTDGAYKHDFIFVRDSFISNGKGDVVISNFSARGRQDEATAMRSYLAISDYTVHELSADAYAEGGEFLILPKENIAFVGINRNNEKGIVEVGQLLGIQDVCIVQTSSFHLDTALGVLLDESGICVAVMSCMDAIVNTEELKTFCTRHNITLIPVHSIDGMGSPRQPGSLAVNGLALPGVFIGGASFTTPQVEESIASFGIEHVVIPLEDLTLSSGSIHCLTNELRW